MGTLYNHLHGYIVRKHDARAYLLDALQNHTVQDQDDFRLMMQIAVERILTKADVSRLTQIIIDDAPVADSTIIRWGQGISRPHPLLYTPIRDGLVKLLTQR